MATLARAFVELLPSMKGIGARIDGEMGPELDRSGRRGGQVLGGSIASGLTTAGAAIGLAAAAGGAAIAGIGVLGLKAGIETAAGMEQARIAFTTMLGSATKADAFLKQLADFAARTPFEFPELQTAASSLISAGFEASKVIPIMTSLGNATSGMGTGSEGVKRATVALQQMSAAGMITGEDLNQLRDAGIPVFDLLTAATGKSKEEVAKLAAAGKLGRTEMTQLFTALETGKGLERFNGLMEKQSQSLTGLWSTFKDTLNMGLAKAVEPLIPMLKDGLGKAAEVASAALPVLAQGLANLVQAFVSVSSMVGPAVAGVQAFFAATGAAGPSVSILSTVLAGLAAFVAAEVTPRISSIVAAVQSFATVALPIVQVFAAGMMERLGPLMPQVSAIFTTIQAIVVDVLRLVLAVVQRATAAITFVWENFGQGIMTFTTAVFTAVIGVVGPALNIVLSIIRTVMALVRGDWSGAWDGIRSIVSSAWDLIKGIVSGALGILGVLVSAGVSYARAVMANAWNATIGDLSGAWSRLQGITAAGVSGLVSFVSGLPGRIAGAFGDLGSAMWNIGWNISEGLRSGVVAGLSRLLGAARDMAVSVINTVRSALGIASPSKVFAQLGTYTAQGMALGIRGGAGDVTSAMRSLVAIPGSFAPGGLSLAGVGSVAAPVVYVENPWTGEYHEARMRSVVDAGNANTGLAMRAGR